MNKRIDDLEKQVSCNFGTQASARGGDVRCFSCNQMGHFARNCPKQAGNENKGLSWGSQPLP